MRHLRWFAVFTFTTEIVFAPALVLIYGGLMWAAAMRDEWRELRAVWRT